MTDPNTNIPNQDSNQNPEQPQQGAPEQMDQTVINPQDQTVIESFGGVENISLDELGKSHPEHDEFDDNYYDPNQEVEGLLANSNFRLILAIVIVFVSAIIFWLILR